MWLLGLACFVGLVVAIIQDKVKKKTPSAPSDKTIAFADLIASRIIIQLMKDESFYDVLLSKLTDRFDSDFADVDLKN